MINKLLSIFICCGYCSVISGCIKNNQTHNFRTSIDKVVQYKGDVDENGVVRSITGTGEIIDMQYQYKFNRRGELAYQSLAYRNKKFYNSDYQELFKYRKGKCFEYTLKVDSTPRFNVIFDKYYDFINSCQGDFFNRLVYSGNCHINDTVFSYALVPNPPNTFRIFNIYNITQKRVDNNSLRTNGAFVEWFVIPTSSGVNEYEIECEMHCARNQKYIFKEYFTIYVD